MVYSFVVSRASFSLISSPPRYGRVSIPTAVLSMNASRARLTNLTLKGALHNFPCYCETKLLEFHMIKKSTIVLVYNLISTRYDRACGIHHILIQWIMYRMDKI